MKVSEVMTRGIDPVAPSASVQEAAVQMAEFDVGAVLVGTAEKLEGVLTDRDIILRVVVDGRNPAEVRVAGRDVSQPLHLQGRRHRRGGLRRNARAADPAHAGL